MWSFMCIFTNHYLDVVPWNHTNCNLLMANMIETLGPLPRQWKGLYNAFNFPGNNPWYDQKRKPNPEVTLKTIIKKS
jgi:hypothetical protein